jgi:hypothetical protein
MWRLPRHMNPYFVRPLGHVVGIPFLVLRQARFLNARRARLLRAETRCAGVVRRPVMLMARREKRDRVRRVIPANARRAVWYCAGVVRSCGWSHGTVSQRAEHAHAADRFAREIEGFLTRFAVRSRRLMGNPFGVRGT